MIDETRLGEYAWYDENSGGQTHPVGQKKPNAWGLYDLYGNVWEWVQDWYGPYQAEVVTDPAGPTEGVPRVLRGGCRVRPGRNMRSAYRNRAGPVVRDVVYGFRLALGQASIQ